MMIIIIASSPPIINTNQLCRGIMFSFYLYEMTGWVWGGGCGIVGGSYAGVIALHYFAKIAKF